MLIEVLGFNCTPIWTHEVISYTVHAGGRLDLVFPDGSTKTYDREDWIDVRLAGSIPSGSQHPKPEQIQGQSQSSEEGTHE